MNDRHSSASTNPAPTLRTPRSSQQAVVRCKDFQCLAYKDAEGRWRSVADDKVLEVVEVVLQF
ncbi:MAG TPA: hypothetical protein VFE51_25515 [Verrucomicrobiae bacterium]|nr:hypothetical protein [Verrucomicrobiae bacterium]